MSRPVLKSAIPAISTLSVSKKPVYFLRITGLILLGCLPCGVVWSQQSSCTKTNFSIGYELTATGEPNSSGQYFYTLTPLRCNASGQVIYDPGTGFSDGYPLGQSTPENAFNAFKQTYLYNTRAFEGSCRFTYVGVHSYYNGAIDGVTLTTANYPVSPTQYRGVFAAPLHQDLSRTAKGVKSDSTPRPATGACVTPDQKKGGGEAGGGTNKPEVCTGNPILPGRGCKVQTEIDYLPGGNSLLSLVRRYDSQDPYHIKSSGPRLVGNRWRLNLEAKLNANIEPNKVLMLRDDGAILHFTPKSGSTTEWAGDADVVETLSKTETGWRYQTADGAVETYDALGQRTERILPDGRSLTYTYNTAGQLTGVTDQTGRTLTLAYNAKGLVTGIADGSGVLVAYTYDADSNLTGATYPDGKTRHYSYTSLTVNGQVEPALLTGITDESAVPYASWAYNTNAQAISSQHAGGVDHHTLTYLSDAQGGILQAAVTNPLNISQTYIFQRLLGSDYLTELTHPLVAGAKQRYEYDAQGNLTKLTDYNGNITTYTYDLTRNLETRRIQGVGSSAQRTVTTQWHPVWRVPVKMTGPNKITTYTYNGDGGLTCAPSDAVIPGPSGETRPINVLCARSESASNDANGSQGLSASPAGPARIWTMTWNARGQLLTEDGPRTDVSDVTTRTYYPLTDASIGKRGNLASVTNALGHITQITAYDTHGNPLTLIDPNGITTTLTYDARQRLTRRTTAGETTRYDYSPTGQLTRVTLPDGSHLAYAYDAAHRLTALADALGNAVHYTLDGAGNRIQEDIRDPQNALTRTRRRVYDGLSRLAREIGAQNQTTDYSYDANGNATSRTGPLNHTTTRSYDALNRLIRITDPLNGQTQTTYNGQDRTIQVKDPRNLITTYTVNGLGDLLSTQSPDSGTVTRAYDSAGNEHTRTDARNKTTTTQYDALNRPTQITDADGRQIQLTWDQGVNGKGRLTRIDERESGTLTLQTEYSYDARGRLQSETRRHFSGGSVLTHSQSYAWTNGRLTNQTLPSGRQLAYSHDAAGRITKIDLTHIAPKAGQTQTIAQAITYHPWGGIKSWTDGAGQSHARTQDQDGRITGYTLGGAAWQLTYDAAGRITGQQRDASLSGGYSYDALDRLTGATVPALTYGYGYDATGNRTTQSTGGTTRTYTLSPTSNRLQSISGPPARNITHDASGNITNDGQTNYGYDAQGRLSQTANAQGTTSYRVGALGQRIKKSGASGETHYHYDTQGRLIAESGADGAIQREYLWLGATPLAVID